jgi:NADH dehydrogenase FAD-containing subunit
VKVHTGTGVRNVGPASIELTTGESVKTQTLIWAAGLQANAVVHSLGLELVMAGAFPSGQIFRSKIVRASLPSAISP